VSDELTNVDIWRSPEESAHLLGLLGAENARLKAEIERLRPKPMTLKEACEVIRDKRHRGDKRWQIEGGMVYLASQKHALCENEAIYIAQGLLRDGQEKLNQEANP
jgi:hypothetical protein